MSDSPCYGRTDVLEDKLRAAEAKAEQLEKEHAWRLALWHKRERELEEDLEEAEQRAEHLQQRLEEAELRLGRLREAVGKGDFDAPYLTDYDRTCLAHLRALLDGVGVDSLCPYRAPSGFQCIRRVGHHGNCDFGVGVDAGRLECSSPAVQSPGSTGPGASGVNSEASVDSSTEKDVEAVWNAIPAVYGVTLDEVETLLTVINPAPVDSSTEEPCELCDDTGLMLLSKRYPGADPGFKTPCPACEGKASGGRQPFNVTDGLLLDAPDGAEIEDDEGERGGGWWRREGDRWYPILAPACEEPKGKPWDHDGSSPGNSSENPATQDVEPDAGEPISTHNVASCVGNVPVPTQLKERELDEEPKGCERCKNSHWVCPECGKAKPDCEASECGAVVNSADGCACEEPKGEES